MACQGEEKGAVDGAKPSQFGGEVKRGVAACRHAAGAGFPAGARRGMIWGMDRRITLPALVLSAVAAAALGASVALWLHYGNIISFEAMTSFVRSCF